MAFVVKIKQRCREGIECTMYVDYNESRPPYTSLTLTVPRRRPVCGIKRVQSTIESERDNPTYPASSNKTDFLTGDGLARDGRGLSDVLVVTTTVRVIDGVHGNTTSARPATKERWSLYM